MNSNFSSRLSEAMKSMGFTQERLAEKLGISHSAVSRWLSGSLPRAARMREVAKVLCVPVSWLESGGESPFPTSDSMLREEPTSYAYQRPPPDPIRHKTLEHAREFNEALEPAFRKLVKQSLRQLDSVLSTAAYNDGGMHESMIRLAHESVDQLSQDLKKLRDSKRQNQ